jgi:hypothetical protein
LEIAVLKFSAPVFFTALFALYLMAGAVDCSALGVAGTVMYAIAGSIFGLVARLSLKVLRWDWRNTHPS